MFVCPSFLLSLFISLLFAHQFVYLSHFHSQSISLYVSFCLFISPTPYSHHENRGRSHKDFYTNLQFCVKGRVMLCLLFIKILYSYRSTDSHIFHICSLNLASQKKTKNLVKVRYSSNSLFVISLEYQVSVKQVPNLNQSLWKIQNSQEPGHCKHKKDITITNTLHIHL